MYVWIYERVATGCVDLRVATGLGRKSDPPHQISGDAVDGFVVVRREGRG